MGQESLSGNDSDLWVNLIFHRHSIRRCGESRVSGWYYMCPPSITQSLIHGCELVGGPESNASLGLTYLEPNLNQRVGFPGGHGWLMWVGTVTRTPPII